MSCYCDEDLKMLVNQLSLAACTAATSSNNRSTVVAADIAMQISQELDQLRATAIEQDIDCFNIYCQHVSEKVFSNAL